MKNNFFMRNTFHDYDKLAEAAYAWNIEITRLERTQSISTLKQLKVEDIQLLNAHYSGKTQQVGEMPDGLTIAFQTSEQSELIWRNKPVSASDLMLFPLGQEFDVATKGLTSNPHTITIPEHLFKSRLQEEEFEIYKKLSRHEDLISVSKSKLLNLETLFCTYFSTVERDSSFLHSKIFRDDLQEELINAFSRVLFSQEETIKQRKPKDTSKIWKLIDEYIQLHKNRPIRITELKQIVGISERSLLNLFQKKFGISPKAYLNRGRLHGVHRRLKESTYLESKIYEVANEWGFWHMGQFSLDYKHFFGELPSETLLK